MGLTKQYLRYVPAGSFNIIANPHCNGVFVCLQGQEGRFVAVGACEHVIIWDMRLDEKALLLSGETSEACHLAASPNNTQLSVGYADGIVKIFDLDTAESTNIFAGHKNHITALVFDSTGHRLASGGKDNEIIIWDVVADAGVCRLSGHKGPITQLVFMSTQNIIISSSKDSFIKLWDLDARHCFKTLVGHKSEVWGITLMKDNRYLVTGSSDAELKVWKLINKSDDDTTPALVLSDLNAFDVDNIDESLNPLRCTYAGAILRNGRGRVVCMRSDPTGQLLACHGTDYQIEFFFFCSDEEAQIRYKKRLKKLKNKNVPVDSEEPESTELPLSLRNEVRRLSQIKTTTKIKSVDVRIGKGCEVRVCSVHANNALDLQSLSGSTNSEAVLLRRVERHGHHSEVRAVNFSSDNLAMVSGSAEGVKLWNKPSQSCLRTIETDYVLSICFVPGDRHVLAGMKNGKLCVLDITVGDVLEEIPAHSSELWSICITPNQRGCVTGGGDNTVKFWDFQLIDDERSESQAKVLSLLHTRTLKLEDNVLNVKLSPNNKLIAVALLDSTVKIFFIDSFKFYLSLYGHKLPVLCMDISTDSTIIATGSADRNIKLWGLDFGDCHKSLFAHDDSVTALQFVPKTHYFFSCGRDGKVKQWDADSFEKIITLPGHIGEAWSLAVSPSGKHVLSSGSDHMLRLWELSDETIILEDTPEEELEGTDVLATGDDTVVPGKGVVSLPTIKTVGSEKAAELLMECLEISTEWLRNHPDNTNEKAPQLPPLMQAYQVDNADDFVLEILKRIRSSDLEEALLLLPLSNVIDLVSYLPRLAARGDQVELVSRVTVFLLRLHSAAITSSPGLYVPLKNIEKHAMMRIQQLRDMVGYNLHSLQFLQRELEVADGVQLFSETTQSFTQNNKKRKQREKRKRLLIALT